MELELKTLTPGEMIEVFDTTDTSGISRWTVTVEPNGDLRIRQRDGEPMRATHFGSTVVIHR